MAAKKKAKKSKKAPAKKAKKKVAKAARRAPVKKAAKRKAKATKKKAPKKVAAKKSPARKAVKKAPASAKKEYGEGNYKATRRFDDAEEAFVQTHRSEIPAMGKAAEAALEGPGGKDLMAAEEEAKGHAAGEEP